MTFSLYVQSDTILLASTTITHCTSNVKMDVQARSIHTSTAVRSLQYTSIKYIVSAHRRILGLASVVCVLVKIRVSSISLYKLDTDKLTAPFESAHQFTLVCTVSDSKTVPGCHYNLCSNHSFVVTDSSLCLFRAVFSLPGHSLPLLYTDLCLLQLWSRAFFFVLRALRKCSCHDRDSPALLDPPPMIEFLELHACAYAR